ncbi:MAG: hypothetical protein ABIO43_05790 [Sphingomicrobium sp.]
MRIVVIAAGLALLPATSALAQLAPAGAIPGGQPELLKSIEPNLATDAASLDEVRYKMQKDRKSGSRGKADQARPAQVAEILAGKAVHDTTGQVIALVEKVDSEGAVLRSGAAVVRVPIEGFGINKKGLLLNLTKPQFDEMIASSGAAASRS